jgi:serine protease AprX
MHLGLAISLLLSSFLSASTQLNPIRAQAVLLQLAQHQPDALVNVIVQQPPQAADLHSFIAQLGGAVTQSLSLINAFAARLPAAAVPELAKNNAVNWVSLDSVVHNTDASPPGILREDFDLGALAGAGSGRWRSGWGWPEADWVEVGEADGPVAGDIAVTSFFAGQQQGLRLQGAAKGIQGVADLSYASSAMLSLAYRRKDLTAQTDFVTVQASADGGATWVDLDQWVGPATDAEMQAATYDLGGFLTASFAVRFITSEAYAPDARVYVDFVQIEYASTFQPTEETREGALINTVFLPLLSGHTAASASGGPPAAPAAPAVNWRTAADYFSSVSYSNNHGSTSWESGWIESDVAGSGAGAGNITIYAGELWLDDNPDTGTQPSLRRQMNFPADVVQAYLSFDFRTTSGVDADDRVVVEVSANGGASYTVLETFQNIAGTRYDWRDYNISAHISSDTVIRFRVATNYGGNAENFVIDSVEIRYTTACAACIDTSNLISPNIRAVGADRLWNEAPYRQGQNVTVAVVDSGIAWHDDLYDDQWYGRLIGGVNFADEWYVDDLNGHGTFVAGVIAGDGYMSDGGYIGVAPRADLVDVKVLDDTGRGYMSDVVAGLQWINDNHADYNIRVVNLSLNSSVYESYHQSPLNAALEILWFNGIVVVVSAGNNGQTGSSTTLYPPANDPFVITVGAVDDKGTLSIADDDLPSFSAYGTTLEGFAKPDLVAPGRNVVSLLASDDSNLGRNHPGNIVAGWAGNTYFRMSGTSVAAPMVSGAAALLLQDEPSLTPDQVKYRLMATATTNWAGYNAARAGAGYLDVYAAVNGATTQNANTGWQVSQLLWSGSQPITWGSVNWNSVNWNAVNWNAVNWNAVNWNAVNWNSHYWEP